MARALAEAVGAGARGEVPVGTVLVGVDGTDLGAVASPVHRIADATRLPRGTAVAVQGQAENMNASFRGLAMGIGFAVVLVYLLMVVNFQS